LLRSRGYDWLVVTAVGVELAVAAVDAAVAAVAAVLVVVSLAASSLAAVVVVAVVALFTAAVWAVGCPVAAFEVRAAWRVVDPARDELAVLRTSASVVVTAWVVAPMLPRPTTTPHMLASRISAIAVTRRRRTLVRRWRALSTRASSRVRSARCGGSVGCMPAVCVATLGSH
jgi:hypothetical protein